MKKLATLLLLLNLSACATPMPRDLRAPDVRPLSIAQAQQTDSVGARVRFGGTIASVRNGKRHTWIEVVQRPLAEDGRPLPSDATEGRFLARLAGFLDPSIYAAGRSLTVVGVLRPPRTQNIGAFAYPFPVVEVTSFHLWRPLPKRQAVAPMPFWYDPWYPWGDPFF